MFRQFPLSLQLIIAGSFVFALLLAIYPLPMNLRWWRPDFVIVIAIYWLFFMPQHFSLLLLCAIGLLQDLLEGVPFGQHSLGLMIIAYVCALTYQRAVNFSLLKQSAWIAVLVAIAQLSDNWVQGLVGRPLLGMQFLYAALASACVWPVLVWWLNHITSRYRLR